jgi:hypothetical protein
MKRTATRIDNRKDLLLLLLYSPGVTDEVNEPVAGRTRLMKMVFLFQKELLPKLRKDVAVSDSDLYEFFPWNFGPFSAAVYDDLNFFQLRGFIESTSDAEGEEDVAEEEVAEWERWMESNTLEASEDDNYGYLDQRFRLTQKGSEFAQSLYSNLSSSQALLLREFKRRLVKAPLRSVLRYVYATYPEQTSKSQIKEQVLGS